MQLRWPNSSCSILAQFVLKFCFVTPYFVLLSNSRTFICEQTDIAIFQKWYHALFLGEDKPKLKERTCLILNKANSKRRLVLVSLIGKFCYVNIIQKIGIYHPKFPVYFESLIKVHISSYCLINLKKKKQSY